MFHAVTIFGLCRCHLAVIGPVAQPWRRPSPHGESLRATAKPSPWRDFYNGDIAPRRHSSPFGDTYQPLATPIAIWRQASQRRDGRENLITFCCPMLYLCCPRDGYRDVISAGLSRFGDPRRHSAICVAVQRPSRNRDFGRDSRHQGCATGPILVLAQNPRTPRASHFALACDVSDTTEGEATTHVLEAGEKC